MKIECSKCGSIYKVKTSKIPDKGASVKCKKCQNRILVKRQSEEQNKTADASKKQLRSRKRKANIKGPVPRKPARKSKPAYDLSKNTYSENQKKSKISTAMFVTVGLICIISSIFLGKFMFSYFSATNTLASVAKSYTRTQYNQGFVSWLKKYLIQDYNEFGNHSPQWDSKVIKVLEKYAVYRLGLYDESFRYEIENDLEKIIDIGCNDPRVNYIYGNIIFRNGYVKKAESIVEKSLKDLEQSEYPAYCRYWSVNKLISIYKKLGYTEELLDPLYTKRLTYLARTAADDRFKKGNQRHYIDILSYDWQGEWGGIPQGYEKFMDEFKQLEDVDPWIDYVVRGRYHISRGWKARGGGWGNTVTSEGWEIFDSELKTAADLLTKAHSMHPELPHAATQMIRIRLAVDGTVNEKEWFERAVNAQFDYMRAYSIYIEALRPRWGGSHKAMMKFGAECLNTKRFDTRVPNLFLDSLVEISKDFDNRNWSEPYRKSGVYRKVQRYFEGVTNEPGRELDYNRLRSSYALYSWACGEYDDAKEIMNELGENFVPEVCDELYMKPGKFIYDLSRR